MSVSVFPSITAFIPDILPFESLIYVLSTSFHSGLYIGLIFAFVIISSFDVVFGLNEYKLEYILKTLRKGKNHIIAISGNSLSILNDIILVIRNNSIASSLLSIVIKADSDPIPIKVSSFYTKSTLVAVAPMVTIKIGESQADIRSFI